jgi:hypothetical protein
LAEPADRKVRIVRKLGEVQWLAPGRKLRAKRMRTQTQLSSFLGHCQHGAGALKLQEQLPGAIDEWQKD